MNDTFDLLPITAGNRPALARIDYAADDLAALRARLLARLPAALPGWNADQAGDYAGVIAELFAQMGAILNLYADQRANESFLRTARLRRSLLDLCELIDYRLGAGASASSLQAFLAKPGAGGSLPAGFQVSAPPLAGGGDKSDLLFQTLTALDIHESRNAMPLSGWNRSGRGLRLSTESGASQDSAVTLDARYAGLKAGQPIVFDDGASLTALLLTAAGEDQGATTLTWAPGSAEATRALAIADLTLRGRGRQIMKLAAAERADEISLGENRLPVEDAALFGADDAVLVDGGGVLMPALVLASDTHNNTLTLGQGVIASLRRSSTRVLATKKCGDYGLTLRAGSTVLPISGGGPHQPAPGDLLLIVHAGGVELGTVAAATNYAIVLAQPVARALRPRAKVAANAHTMVTAALEYFSVAFNDSGASQTRVRPLLLGSLPGIYSADQTVLALDKSYEGLTPGMVLALSDGTRVQAMLLAAADSLDGKTVLTLRGDARHDLRVATLGIHGPFEHAMRVAGWNYAEGYLAAGASQLDLDAAPQGLKAGLDLVIADADHAEGARITQVQPLADRVRVSLARPLEQTYALGDARVHGNVAAVTHGASLPDEVLGSGNPAAAPQSFTLRRPALALVADANAARGVAPALEIRVGGERWTRVDTLAASGPLDHHWALHIDENERATVLFGDGAHGAPVPSGRNNIVARYRVGHGARANVAAAAIAKMPRAMPFVAKSFNPMPASGGADSETPDGARRQAAHRIRTLDRAVSLADYADLALTFAGVAKARADLEREGRGAAGRNVIVVTCAAAGGSALSTPQKEALLAYLAARSGDAPRLRLRDHRTRAIRLALSVDVAANWSQAEVQRALLARFGGASGSGGFFAFERRELGGALRLSEVYAEAEATPGVDHVLATLFHAEAEPARVADRIGLPADTLASGGDAADAGIGRLSLLMAGGLP